MSEDQVTLLIDRDECIGYGECVSEDPEAVALGEDGCARSIVATLDRARAERICAVCPTGAITVSG
jgi:ferredoxin